MSKMRWFGLVGVTQGHSTNSTIRQSAYKFLLAFHSNNVPILLRFWDIARCWLKIANLNLPHIIRSLRAGVQPTLDHSV